MAMEHAAENAARNTADAAKSVADASRNVADDTARRAADGATIAQQNYQQLMTASERFMTGVVKAAVKQLEVSRGLLQGGLEDFDRLLQARTPESFLQAQLELIRNRSERMMNGMQAVSDELTRAWGESVQRAQPARSGEAGLAHGGSNARAATA